MGVGERGNGAVAGGGDSDLRSPGLRLDCKSMTPGGEAGGGRGRVKTLKAELHPSSSQLRARAELWMAHQTLLSEVFAQPTSRRELPEGRRVSYWTRFQDPPSWAGHPRSLGRGPRLAPPWGVALRTSPGGCRPKRSHPSQNFKSHRTQKGRGDAFTFQRQTRCQ